MNHLVCKLNSAKMCQCTYYHYIVEAVVDGVQALVDLPFILMLKDFVVESIKPLTSTSEEIKPTEALDIEDAGVFVPPSPDLLESPSDVTTEKPSPKNKEKDSEEKIVEGTNDVGKLTIKAKIKKPLVALVEDAKDTDSRALVLNVSINWHCCILKTVSHRHCNNSITDIVQEMM